MQKTDSRTLAQRKASVTMRRVELETQLREVVKAEAEIDREIEEQERGREGAKFARNVRSLWGIE